jgi:hypothetical protein
VDGVDLPTSHCTSGSRRRSPPAAVLADRAGMIMSPTGAAQGDVRHQPGVHRPVWVQQLIAQIASRSPGPQLQRGKVHLDKVTYKIADSAPVQQPALRATPDPRHRRGDRRDASPRELRLLLGLARARASPPTRERQRPVSRVRCQPYAGRCGNAKVRQAFSQDRPRRSTRWCSAASSARRGRSA